MIGHEAIPPGCWSVRCQANAMRSLQQHGWWSVSDALPCAVLEDPQMHANSGR